MKIILANRYFYPDQSATSRMVSSLAFSLARQGFSVTALASRTFQNGGEAVLPAHEVIQGVDVHRLRSSRFGRGKLVGRAADYLTFHLSAAAWWLAHARRGDLCVVCTDPPLLAVTSALPVALRGAKLVNWVMDLFPEAAVELGVIPKSGVMTGPCMALRDWSVNHAALTICPMRAMAAYLHERDNPAERIVTVNHWSDGDEIRPVEPADNLLRKEWGLEDAFVVGYSGNFGRAHEFSTLLDAADALRHSPDIRFLLIGDGQQRAVTQAEVERRGLSNVIFKPYQPSERLAESLCAADVHVVSLLPRLEHCIVPSKFYGVLAAGRPTLFIGDTRGEVASACRAAFCGESVAPGEAAQLTDHIRRLKSMPEERALMGRRARQLMETEYTLASGVGRWRQAVSHLLPGDVVRSATAVREEATT